MLVGALTGYAGRAYAACDPNPASPVFLCSGPQLTTEQDFLVNNAQVSTASGFGGVDTTDPFAIKIVGDGALSYTDANASPLTAANDALHIVSTGDIPAGNQGSVTVVTNGRLTGGTGLNALNFGSGALDIKAYGVVTGTNNFGILARNGDFIAHAGSDLTVTTGAGSTVTGDLDGIFARNFGTGQLTVKANGDVTGSFLVGIYAFNVTGTDLTVTTGAGTTVTGGLDGISLRNYGSGALKIETNGDVGDAITPPTQDGIFAFNSGNGTGLAVTTGVNTTVTGGDRGISARNYGSGALTVKAYGNVTGTNNLGIFARNYGTDLTITTGAGTNVTGGNRGISARNYGSGALTIFANGDVTGTNDLGIFARNYGTALTVTTAAGTTVGGYYAGLVALNYGSGALSITANGDVTGGYEGIYAYSGGTPISITVGSASHVTSTGTGAGDFAIDIVGGPASVVVAGTVNGGAGGAISFDQCGCGTDDRLELQPGAVINGNVFAGLGTDSFVLGGEGTASFDVASIGAGLQYQDFETFAKEDGSHWTLTGTNTTITNFAVNGGLLSVNGAMPNTAFTVNGGTLGGSGVIGSFGAMSGGIVAPGNSIGTLNVAGNVAFDAGSVYQVEVNAAGASDKIIAGGTATILGGTVEVLAENGDYNPSTTYIILTAQGGRSGEFNSVTSNLAFLDPTLTYDPNDVVLTLVRNNTPMASVAATQNQASTAAAAEASVTPPAEVSAAPCAPDDALCLALLNLTAEQARQAFEALSGGVHASVSGILADDSRYVREAVLGRLMQASHTNNAGQLASLGAGGPQVASLDSQAMAVGYDDKSLAPAPASPGLAFWTNAFGAWGDFDGNKNAASAERNLGGFVSGMDARVSGTWRLGLATGYSQSDISVDALHSGAEVESFHLAGYAGGNLGPLALRSGGAWAWNDINTSRAVVFPGYFEREKASYSADTGQLFGEAAYPLAMGGMALEPFAGLAFVEVNTDSFKERGELAALTGRDNDEDVTYSTLGLRAATTMHVSNMVFTPHVSAAWQHAFDDVTPDAALAFASTGIGFDVTGVPLAENSLLVEAGLDLNLSPTATLGVSYSGQIASDLADNAVKGRFTWLF
jgi:outer membrane autotransporter protein